LIYLVKGRLPWQSLQAGDKKKKYQLILEKKISTPVQELSKGLPNEFVDYFKYCSNLGFEQKPDYEFLKNIFKQIIDKLGYERDGIYDWTYIKKKKTI